MDLEDLIQRNDSDSYQSFVPDQAGTVFVDKVFQGSADYAAKVGDASKRACMMPCVWVNERVLRALRQSTRPRNPEAVKLP